MLVDGLEKNHFLAAGRAPACPEMDQGHLALEGAGKFEWVPFEIIQGALRWPVTDFQCRFSPVGQPSRNYKAPSGRQTNFPEISSLHYSILALTDHI